MSTGRDVGEEILAQNAALVTTVTAGGAGDATEIDGISIDRQSLGSLYESCKLSIVGAGNVTSGLTLTVTANMQDSDDGSTWADYGTAYAATVVLTGASGGSTQSSFQVFLDNDLRPAKRYIRCQVTPDMSDTDDDTALIAAVLVLGGASTNPAN